MGSLDFLSRELDKLADENLLRRCVVQGRGDILNLSSNDYLGFGGEQTLVEGATGSGASPLVSGFTSVHAQAEARIAEWVGYEGALLFSSGYAANTGVIAALAGPGDVIYSDALNHASIVDGCRLSRAQVCVFEHLSMRSLLLHLELTAKNARRRFIVTESMFSMDADGPDLRALCALADSRNCVLIVDESHALGVFGPSGRGLCSEAQVQPDVLIAGLGKAVGLQGGAVLGSALLRTFLWNRARSLVYSTALSPLLAGVLLDRIPQVAAADSRRTSLWAATVRLRNLLLERGATLRGLGPILPWVMPTSSVALGVQEGLLGHGILVGAIRPPTVPFPRVRLSASALLTDDDFVKIDAAVSAVWSSNTGVGTTEHVSRETLF